MAQLHHILGAILRDIAQARLTSDIYSREVSQFYERDSLLRLFPIPRSEIKELDVDLRFAVSRVEIDAERTDERQAKIGGLLDRYSETVTLEIFKDLKDPSAVRELEEWQNLIAGLDTAAFRSDLRMRILEFLEANSRSLITITEGPDGTDVSLDIAAARKGINAIVDELIYRREDVQALQAQFDILSGVKASVSSGIRRQLEALESDLEFVAEIAEFKLEVDVTAEKLQAIPDAAVSSIKISATMRNYVWSQVEEKDGVAVRRLIPE